MASTFAMPLMSTVDSSLYVRSHSHTGSHHRSSQRLTRPFGLARIPSERLDPRSDSYDRTSRIHQSGEKREEHGNMNRTSFGANESISAPSLSPDRQQLRGIPKRSEATTRTPQASELFQSQSYRSSYVDAKGEASTSKMGSKSRWAIHHPQTVSAC
jgi:hypothetical protein